MVTYMIDLGRGANTPLPDIDARPSLRLRLAQSPPQHVDDVVTDEKD